MVVAYIGAGALDTTQNQHITFGEFGHTMHSNNTKQETVNVLLINTHWRRVEKVIPSHPDNVDTLAEMLLRNRYITDYRVVYDDNGVFREVGG